MAAIADLYTAIKADMSTFDSDLQKGLTRSADKGGKTFADRFKRQLTASNIGATVGAALGGLSIAALRLGDAYATAIDNIRIGTGATGDALEDLTVDMSAVAQRVPDDIAMVGQAIADINTRTGQTGEGLQALTEQILDLSRITRTDLGANIAASTRLFGDWSVATEDQAATLDKVFRASQMTGASVTTLMQQVVAFGAPLRSLGFSLEEGVALLGKWEKEGVNVETLLSGLRMAVSRFASTGIDPREGLPALIAKLEETGDAQGLLEVKQIAGQRAANDFFRAVKEGRFDLDDLVEGLNNGSDTIAQATTDTDGFKEAWRSFKNTVAVTVGPIVKDFADIGTELGNLVYLLPALGGVLGKGLGALWTKAGAGAAVRAAIAAAGATAGAIYQAAVFAVAPFTAAAQAAWVALGAPGSAMLAKAHALGQLAGTRFTLGVVAGVVALPIVLQEAMKAADILQVPDALKGYTAENLALLGTARRKVSEFEEERLDLANQLNARYGEQGEEVDALRARYDELNESLGILQGGTREQVAYLLDNGIDAYREWAGSMEGVKEVAGELEGDIGDLEAAMRGSGASFADVFANISAAVGTAAGTIQERANEVVAEMQELMSAIGLVAERGIKGLRKDEKAADKAWKNIIGAGDANKRRLREVREDIDKWQARLRRAIRQNDSEGAAFAQAQLTRLTEERDSRQEVVDWVKAQREAMNKLPEKTTTAVEAPGLQAVIDKVTSLREKLGSLYGTDIRITTSGGSGPQFRASGGPVSAHTPYVVGEEGREIFVPRTSGDIIANDRIGGDTYNITPHIHGLPQRARTPREVVAELRRATRMGLASPAVRRAWEPT